MEKHIRNIVRAGSACPLLDIILFLALTAYGQQQERVAIINSVDNQKLLDTPSSSSAVSSASVDKASGLEKIITHYELDANKSFTDTRDGKKYKTVVIGKQTWMAENLNYEAKGSKCYGEGGKAYNPKTKKFDIISKTEIQANCKKYGRLYNWATAMEACPKGWHLPSDKDWNVLMKFVNPSCSDNSTCEGAGTKLKATSGWNKDGNKSGNGTDDYGFSALPGGQGGHGDSYGNFSNVGDSGHWWSASEDDAYNAYYRIMAYFDENVYRISYSKDYSLFSVRCVKD